MRFPKLPKSVVAHYAALAISEGVSIELKMDGVSVRISPSDAEAESQAGTSSDGTEHPRRDGLKPW